MVTRLGYMRRSDREPPLFARSGRLIMGKNENVHIEQPAPGNIDVLPSFHEFHIMDVFKRLVACQKWYVQPVSNRIAQSIHIAQILFLPFHS